MDKSTYSSDLEKFSQNLYASMDSNTSNGTLKRKADEISQNPYENTNKELRELYFLRKQMREKESQNQGKSSEKTLIDLSNCMKPSIENKQIPPKETKPTFEETKDVKGSEIPKKQVDSIVINSQVITEQTPKVRKDPVMWINKLRIYPPDFILDHMITFRQMMYEDLLRNSN